MRPSVSTACLDTRTALRELFQERVVEAFHSLSLVERVWMPWESSEVQLRVSTSASTVGRQAQSHCVNVWFCLLFPVPGSSVQHVRQRGRTCASTSR